MLTLGLTLRIYSCASDLLVNYRISVHIFSIIKLVYVMLTLILTIYYKLL